MACEIGGEGAKDMPHPKAIEIQLRRWTASRTKAYAGESFDEPPFCGNQGRAATRWRTG
jgi:hypothetical protein